ncbi:MAG: hypothetical protein R3C11_03195 [Planctomycetaceae bacterium]
MSSPENKVKNERVMISPECNLIKKAGTGNRRTGPITHRATSILSGISERVVQALHAPAGEIWLLDDNKQLQLVADLKLEELGFYKNPGSLQKNHQLLVQNLSTGEAVHRPGNPAVPLLTDHIVILAFSSERGNVSVYWRSSNAPMPRQALTVACCNS